MQGLVSYGNSPSPTPSPPVRSSKLPTAQQQSTSTSAGSPSIQGVIKHAKDRSAASSSSISTPPANKPHKHGSAALNAEAGPSGSKAASLDDRSITDGRPSKKRRTSPTSSSAKDHSIPSKPLPQNLTHTSQSSLPTSELAHEPVAVAEEAAEVAGWPGYPGLSDDEVFRLVTAPRQIEGLEDWGIPRARPQEDVDPALQARVTHFLKLKDEQGEHINTRLLGSSAFANPRIYSQLIDFVSISEHTSAFPAGGWLTRRNIEAEIATHGPAALDAQQRALADAAKRSREAEGTSRQIGFVSARKGDQEQSRPVKDGHWDGRAVSSRGGSRERDAYKARDRQRERERERDRYRGKDGGRGHPRERY